MGRKVLCLMLMILALAPCAQAETPRALPQCSTREEVEAGWTLAWRKRMTGYLRPRRWRPGACAHCQDIAEDPTFVGWYWLGGEEGGHLDLTQRTYGVGQQYKYYCGNMCTRAVYSMALSYLGVDCTPGGHERADGYAQPGGAL